jgi:hypothetical protein
LANKLTKQRRLLVAFDALFRSEAIGRDATLGKIMHDDRHAQGQDFYLGK